MTLKRMISACVPSYFVDRVRLRRFEEEKALAERQEKERIERERAEREASSWEDACRRAGSYDEESFNRFRIARAANHKPDGSILRGNILNLVAIALAKPGMIVTDLGGSTGELGTDFVAAYPASRYTVVENKTLARLADAAGLACDRLRFATSIPDRCDIFYSSGTLQYLYDPMETLLTGFRSAARAVVLRRNNFSELKLFDIQKSRLFENGHGKIPGGYEDSIVRHPRRTIQEESVQAMAKSNNFELVLRIDCETVGERRYSRQLVFLRN